MLNFFVDGYGLLSSLQQLSLELGVLLRFVSADAVLVVELVFTTL